MTPRQFLAKYQNDRRLVTGEFFSPEPLVLEPGDQVGVVLLNVGGPNSVEEVAPFLYNQLMDPAGANLPGGRRLRHWLSKFITSLRAKSVAKEYEVIGGGSPITRLTREQADSLKSLLNERYGERLGVEFHAYIAMRYGHPFSEEAAAQMKLDAINKVVLLPLYPQYSKTTTGSSLSYWWTLEQAGELPTWPTTYVFEYAAHPKYIQALSERIDQALQRFPKHLRGDVQLLFSAHGTPVKEMKEQGDPYCCLIHATVDCVMTRRQNDRPCHVAFQGKVGLAEWLTPSTPDTLKALAKKGKKAVLVIPVAFVADHIGTSYELDIAMREEAEAVGILYYEVMPALNCHPLFIEALAEATAAQLTLAGEAPDLMGGGNGTGAVYPLRPLKQQPTFLPSERTTRCHQCPFVTEAHTWISPSEPSVAMQPKQSETGA